MNVLLVMPETGYMWDEWATPPAGIAYVSSYLKQNKVTTIPVNMNLENDPVEVVLRRYIERYNINALGTAELVVNYQKIQEICRCARKIKPDIKIWVGGGLPTNSPIETMELVPEADFCMIGEGEVSSLELVAALEAGLEPLNVSGLVVRRETGELYQTNVRKPIPNLDQLPFPDWEGFRLVESCQKYRGDRDSIVAAIISSRSCPNSCTFCSKTIKKQTYRKRTLDNIFVEIDELVQKYHVTQLNFTDELFADSSDRLYQFCDRIEPYHLHYRVSMHVGKNLTINLLKRMYQSGCRVIFYGLESADNTVLKSMRKAITIEEIERCLLLTKRAGIVTEGNFIFGDPAETKESVAKTLNWIDKHFSLGMFEVAPIKLYPGSQLYEDAVQSGKIQDTVKFIEEECPLINVSGLSNKDYKTMLEHDLTAVQHMRRKRQADVTLFQREKKVFSSYTCDNCGEDNEIYIKDRSQLIRLYTAHCKKCDALEYLNIFPLYYDFIHDTLQKLLSDHTVAFFGCGNIWKTFYETGDIFADSKYYIVDETPYLQSIGWHGRQVYSPAVLNELGVDIVIGMVRITRLELEEKLFQQYRLKNVTVRMCYELMRN